jgi:thiol-disulfide isomerase/thioredoxin
MNQITEFAKENPVVIGIIIVVILAIVIGAVVGSQKKGFRAVPKKNELVFYHAGWCGYCKEFMPVFDATSPELKAQFPELIITKYQEENDRDAIQSANPPVEGFPTIRLNGAEFEGPRTSEGLLMFVQKNYM